MIHQNLQKNNLMMSIFGHEYYVNEPNYMNLNDAPVYRQYRFVMIRIR